MLPWVVTGFADKMCLAWVAFARTRKPNHPGLPDWKPYNVKAYQLETMLTDITTALDDLGLQRAIYMGYSSGGGVGFGLAHFAPEHISALIIGGASPYYTTDDRAGRTAWAIVCPG
jgi:pimeloyl-ACP methyl ester carboxylesterase